MFTILGATGYIGSHLLHALEQMGIECYAPERNAANILTCSLGHVIYCIGITADFRRKPFETVESHVCYLKHLLETATFDSFLYLSSTRVYQRSESTREQDFIQVSPQDPSDLYNLSKLMGESLCLSSGREGARVARLSNVFGFAANGNVIHTNSENFLDTLIRDALKQKKVTLQTSLTSEKDYISINEVVSLIPRIALEGRQTVYNLASGRNTGNYQVAHILSEQTGCTVTAKKDAPDWSFPLISTTSLNQEFNFIPDNFDKNFKELISYYKNHLEAVH